MLWIKRGALAIVALLLLAVIGVYASGNGPLVKIVWDIATGAPELPFDPAAQPAQPPDYAEAGNWAALPTTDDPADLVPQGVSNKFPQGDSPIDVFFIHPTGFLKGSSWTFDMNPETSTEENTRWMMANNASAYNGCCNIYAPRYRQATIFAYMGADEQTRDEVLSFAYTDVERAFNYFLDHHNHGRPFVLAAHSQGTHHGMRLLKEKIDGTPLVQQMVAAYLIGGFVSRSEVEDLRDVALCDSPEQLHCLVHWDTYSVAGIEENEAVDTLCTNPLSWRLDGGLAGKEQHAGAVGISGEYHLEFSGDDAARGVVFNPLGKPLQNYVEAQCSGGRLYISDQSDTPFGQFGSMGDTYHGLDYPMFHMDIRENAILRANVYLQSMGTSAEDFAPTEVEGES